MSKLRRYFENGSYCFLTHVTFHRKSILADSSDLLLDCLHAKCRDSNAELYAWVILPDHFHIIVNAPGGDISKLVQRVKMSFSARYRKEHNLRSGRIWQLRFWDHIIRDETDLNCHIDYIHYNPVKHGLVADPFLWEKSSLVDYLDGGFYSRDWGFSQGVEIDGEFGE